MLLPLADHILFLLLGIVLPVILLVTGNRRRKGTPIRWSEKMKVGLYYSNGLLLYGMAAAVVVTWLLTGRPLTEIGLGWGKLPYDLTAVLLLVGFLVLYLLDLYYEAGSPASREETRQEFKKLGFLPVNAYQFLHFLFLALAAGVGEEIVYRGFMINYLSGLFGDTGWAVVVVLLGPAIAFGVGHIYQGWRAVGKIIAMAVLFGFFLLRTNTLWPLILIHTAVDVLGGLLSWYLQGREE
ncbi:CPBP family intramembrane metalloprotease [Neolewinella aurantiaca]|uniref:CPBP family intramembrane metalloprotease n=1 Tax=Neolewinella aurantiaca TaxID=2602767 RepID=A0A5C7FJH9_9BACT|nr:CPBP family intramembrane glutamic endopeptidase [Neolewinella aurantiaca]TXF91445.1 CPBP family intramembrane metalloprotease [Neolewinella aurantiaca]